MDGSTYYYLVTALTIKAEARCRRLRLHRTLPPPFPLFPQA